MLIVVVLRIRVEVRLTVSISESIISNKENKFKERKAAKLLITTGRYNRYNLSALSQTTIQHQMTIELMKNTINNYLLNKQDKETNNKQVNKQ